MQAAPRELSGDQSVVVVALQQVLQRPEVERRRVMTLLATLSQPLLSAPVKELKKALLRFQKDDQLVAFVTACEAVAEKYARQPEPGPVRAAEPRGAIRREDLRLICFEFLS